MEIAVEVLRESIRSRCAQTLPAALALAAAIPATGLLLLDEVRPARLLLWLAPLTISVMWRVVLTRAVRPRIDSSSAATLRDDDALLRMSSIANQAIAGAGMWLVGLGGTEHVMYFITLSVALFAFGATLNLWYDYRSFSASLPLLMVQPLAFWLIQGQEGWRIAVLLALMFALMFALAKRSAREFAEGVALRSEKARLLARVEREKATAEEALATAREAMRLKAVFLAAASHDLRQPLYAISILADTLAHSPLPAAAAGIVGKQREAIGVLRSLFDNLLDLSRFDAGEIKPVIRVIGLRDLVGSLVTEQETLCREKGLRWTSVVDDAFVATDPELARRLLGNLLANAVRYTASGEVRFAATLGAGRVAVTVADTGPGIAGADQARVFEEFVQLENPGRTRDRGVGLGLSIVKRIDTLLATGLRMHSAPGRGTRFELELPLGAPGTQVEAGAKSEPPERAVLAGLRLWVVEDDPLVRGALASLLQAWDVDFSLASGADDLFGLHDRDGGWPDAVILDDMLEPGEQGLEIARSLATRMPQRRIALVTGNVDPARRQLLEASGFVVMRKPLNSNDLAAWIARATAAGS